ANAKVPVSPPLRHQDPRGQLGRFHLDGERERSPVLSTVQVQPGRKFVHDEIDVFTSGHALKIEARLKATLFPAVNRAFQVARAQLWLELLRGEANERLRTGLEQMKPEQVVSHVLALLDNLQPAIDVSQGVRSALPRLARQ